MTLSTNEITTFLQEEYFACTTIQLNPWLLSDPTLAPTKCIPSYQAYMHPVVSLVADILTGIAAVQMWIILFTRETAKSWGKICRLMRTIAEVCVEVMRN